MDKSNPYEDSPYLNGIESLSSLMSTLLLKAAMGDIVAIVHAFERDVPGGFVGQINCCLERCATGGDAEHAATGCDQATILHGCARVEDLDACEMIGVFNAADGNAGAIFTGIAAGGEHERDGVAWMPERIQFHWQCFREVQHIDEVFAP